MADSESVSSGGSEEVIQPPHCSFEDVYLASETREEMVRAFRGIATSRLAKGPDYGTRRNPIFNLADEGKLLSFLAVCTDAQLLGFTESFLADCGGSRRGMNGSRLVFAPSFMDDLREGLRDTFEPLEPGFLDAQIQGFKQALAIYRERMPSFGVPLEEEDEKNLRQIVKKIQELTRHLNNMLFHTENRGQSDLIVALVYKIQKLLDVPQTFAFSQMVLDALLELTGRYLLVESKYGFTFEGLVQPYVEILQKRLETRADAVTNSASVSA